MGRSDYSNISSAIASEGYNSASCQFFICTTDDYSATLDGSYAAFGKVTEGLEYVIEISNVDVETRDSGDDTLKADKPLDPPVINSIRVDTFGVDFGMPDTLEPFDYNSWLMQQYYGYSY